jgi:16S rRNA (uracil1498-N3)-methyltransferase
VVHTPHIYLAQPWPDQAVAISPTAMHHLLKVLRLDSGATVTYTDGAGHVGEGHVAESSVVRGEEQFLPPPSVAITIAVAPPHDKDRLRFMVEKLGELEVTRIVFLRTRFGAPRLPDHSRTTSWAIGALEQCRGAWLTEVSAGWIDVGELGSGDVWFADPDAPKPGGLLPSQLTIAIGPEGGWAPGEIPEGAVSFGLGRTVLRTETAAIVVAGVLRSYRSESGTWGK